MQVESTASSIEPVEGLVDLKLADDERAAVYRWLSGVFARELTVEALQVYSSDQGSALLGELREIEPLAPAVDGLRARISGATETALKSIALDLAGEFALLFLGVAGRRSAPPYQSFYVSAEARVMQHSAAEMQAELRRLDARLTENFAELPDHVAVQLAAMAELVETANAARQANFLEQRLANWIGEFRDRCVAVKPEGFYAAAACALVDYVHAEAKSLRG